MKRMVFCLMLVVFAGRTVSAVDLSDVRIRTMPFAVQAWTFHNFTFFETLEKVHDLGIANVEAYSGQPLSADMPGVVFGPDMTQEQFQLVRSKLRETGIRLVGYGVVNFANNEESMRKVFDFARQLRIGVIMTEPAWDDWSLLDQMVKEYNIKIAIHNHAIPNKYARPETVYAQIVDLDPRIGICPDTGHWMRSGINPVAALTMFEGRIHNVHLKDLNEFGSNDAYDVPFGSGKGNIRDILALLTTMDYRGYLTIEHENEAELENPSPSIRKGLDYVAGITYFDDSYKEILSWNNGLYSKAGWNHYGPGIIELDRETGILSSTGGMGLLWYAAEKYDDFVIELDYRCSHPNTNSGVFIRVPDMPASDDYIYHSFEIQIGDDGEGIHSTGAVYDAEAPTAAAFKPTGEWNHYMISFVGDRIQIELNGVQVVDWRAEPRGKIRDFSREGYVGLQNHDWNTTVQFRNVFVKKL